MGKIKSKKTIKRGTKDAQEKVRLLIIDYLKNKKGTQKKAGELFGITLNGVQKIWRRYKDKGKRGLISKKRGIKNGIKLKRHQAAEIRKIIKDNFPDQIKLPFGLWTREAIEKLIKIKYKIEISRWQVSRYLQRWGYTKQKPINKAFEQNSESVKEWLEKDYPAIKTQATKENAIIYFVDETSMRSDQQAGKSYDPKGVASVIKKTGQKFSLNMISAISNKGHLEFMIIDGRFNSEIFQKYLEQLIKYKKQKIIFITDGHPAHKTKKLNEWLDINKQKIELFFYPHIAQN